MPWYAVSYDLRREMGSEDYKKLYAALQSATDWCWPLDSFWIIETPLAPSAVISTLIGIGAIDDNDGVVVLEITGAGDFRRARGPDAPEWLNSHLRRS